MSKISQKPCDLCRKLASVRYRIQCDKIGKWVLVCRPCWDKVSKDNPDYRYGGTWKGKK